MTAERIKLLRERNGFTQTELAKKLNITRSSVNAWEMGVSVPSTQYVVELALLFRVSTDYILGVCADDTMNLTGLTEEEKRILSGLLQYFQNNRANNYIGLVTVFPE